MKYRWVVLAIMLMLAIGLWTKKDEVTVLGATSSDDCALIKSGDLDCDGKITIADFAIWKNNFLKYRNSPTSGMEVKPTATSAPMGCKWCGTSCVSTVYKGMCLDVMPPAGQSCVLKDNQCVVESEVKELSCEWCGNSCLQAPIERYCATIRPPAGKDCVAKDGKCQIVDLTPTAGDEVKPRVTGSVLKCEEKCVNDVDCESGYCHKGVSDSRLGLAVTGGVCRNKLCPETVGCECGSVKPKLTTAPGVTY